MTGGDAARSALTVRRFALRALGFGLGVYLLAHAARDVVLVGTAEGFARVLSVLGEDVEREGTLVRGAQSAFLVVDECSAVVPLSILLGAVGASPVPLARRLLGAFVLGTVLLAINQIRLLSLWWVAVWRPEWFEWIHGVLWQPLLVLAVLVLWFPWFNRALADVRARQTHHPRDFALGSHPGALP